MMQLGIVAETASLWEFRVAIGRKKPEKMALELEAAFQATAKREQALVRRTPRDFQSEKKENIFIGVLEPEERMQAKHSGCRSMQHPHRTRTVSLFGHPKAQDPSIA